MQWSRLVIASDVYFGAILNTPTYTFHISISSRDVKNSESNVVLCFVDIERKRFHQTYSQIQIANAKCVKDKHRRRKLFGIASQTNSLGLNGKRNRTVDKLVDSLLEKFHPRLHL